MRVYLPVNTACKALWPFPEAIVERAVSLNPGMTFFLMTFLPSISRSQDCWFSWLKLLVTNSANSKWCKKTEKWLKPLHMGTHLKVLSESYPMNTNMTGFRRFSKKKLRHCALDESSLIIRRVKDISLVVNGAGNRMSYVIEPWNPYPWWHFFPL